MTLTSSHITLLLSQQPLARVYIGYSGGIDSHVLLHLCAAIPEIKPKLTAVYVHHGLQSIAEEWAQHCLQVATALGIELVVLRVNARAQPGESPEEAARNARYAALQELMQPECALLVAQHREDQLETVLLQLFRGGGLRGLSGMPISMPFGQGRLIRPLLDVAKQEIVDYAHAHQLHWVEDPSNEQVDFDRNFLRNDILPLLKQRWPTLDKTVSRSAAHCASAESLLGQMAEQWLGSVLNVDDNTLSLLKLRPFEFRQQLLIVRAWLQRFGLKMPAQMFVVRVLSEVANARLDADPQLKGQGVVIRRYRDRLYCVRQAQPVLAVELVWPKGINSLSIGNGQVLSYIKASCGISEHYWHNAQVAVRYRQGGEKLVLPGRKGSHTLKDLFQEAGIPPWQRAAMPLVYLDGKLAAVGDRWIGAEFLQENTEAVRLCLTNEMPNYRLDDQQD